MVMLVPCIGIWVLTISGIAMWWKRRPRGAIGAPPRMGASRATGLILTLALAGVVLPLFGVSLLVVGLIDLALRRSRTAVIARDASGPTWFAMTPGLRRPAVERRLTSRFETAFT